MNGKDHIFNLQRIVQKITRNKDVPNLYEKVNQIVKGATTGTPDLIEEVLEIVAAETKALNTHFKAKKKALLKAQAA